ncbi:MAG: hypothetical protein ACJ8AT_33015 [Hyalangium sp.]|uniref:hypothetical protein n=1 Tax=Hyalangium sp. TaxID=2028555 RepID=UPI003899AD18
MISSPDHTIHTPSAASTPRGRDPAQILVSSEGGSPVRVDLPKLARELQASGLRCRLTEDGLWAAKVGLSEHGEISLDGRVGGLSPAELGQGVEAFKDVLRRTGMLREGVALSNSRPAAKPAVWKRGPRPPSSRLQGRRAEQATERFRMLLDERGLQHEQLGAGRFCVEARVFYNPPSGRIKVKGRKTYPIKGLIALAHLLAQEVSDPGGGMVGNSLALMAALLDPLERMWATSVAARAMRLPLPRWRS